MGTQETSGEQQYLEPHPILLYDIRFEHIHTDAGHLYIGHIEHDSKQRLSHIHNRIDATKTSDDNGSRVEEQREYYFNARIPLV